MIRDRCKRVGKDYKEYLYSLMAMKKSVSLDEKRFVAVAIEVIAKKMKDVKTRKLTLKTLMLRIPENV